MIAIIDYGMGNLHSVSKAVERLGYDYIISANKDEILAADAVILPGVGAFGDAMEQLNATGLATVVKQYVATKKPLLGICLGMQLLFDSSEEHGKHEGLSLIEGDIVRFEGDFKIPHMGWNKVQFKQASPIFNELEEGYVYFVHSFHAKLKQEQDLLATTDYYGPVTAIVNKDNVYGMQFHPEKSGELGMKLLQNFLALSK